MNNKTFYGIVAAILVVVGIVIGYTIYGTAKLASGRGGTSNADDISVNTLSVLATTTVASQGVPAPFNYGGQLCAIVKQSFTTATNTPAILLNPFGTTLGTAATTSFSNVNVAISSVGNTGGVTFDIATTSGAGTASTNATTSAVLAKAIVVAAGNQYYGVFNPPAATSTPWANQNGPVGGVLPGNDTFGQSTWLLFPTTTPAVMLKIASTTVVGSITGTMSTMFCKVI